MGKIKPENYLNDSILWCMHRDHCISIKVKADLVV